MILLASTSKKNLSRWEQAVSGHAPVVSATNMDSVKRELIRIKPQMLLLDYELPQLNGPDLPGLMKLNPETKTIILSPLLPEEVEWGLFKTGIRGCCRSDVEPSCLPPLSSRFNEGNYGSGER
jgi:DNA-binding NarL/FixJ family response regulator